MNGQIVLGVTLLALGVVLHPILPVASYVILSLALIVAVVDKLFEI